MEQKSAFAPAYFRAPYSLWWKMVFGIVFDIVGKMNLAHYINKQFWSSGHSPF